MNLRDRRMKMRMNCVLIVLAGLGLAVFVGSAWQLWRWGFMAGRLAELKEWVKPQSPVYVTLRVSEKEAGEIQQGGLPAVPRLEAAWKGLGKQWR